MILGVLGFIYVLIGQYNSTKKESFFSQSMRNVLEEFFDRFSPVPTHLFLRGSLEWMDPVLVGILYYLHVICLETQVWGSSLSNRKRVVRDMLYSKSHSDATT